MKPRFLLAACLLPWSALAGPIALVQPDASASAVRRDGAVAYVARSGAGVSLRWRDAGGATTVVATDGVPDTPAWSPDGAALAWSMMAGENANIAVRSLATGDVRHVGATGDSETHPFFSPDGTKLVYTRLVSDGAGAEPRLFESDLRPGGAEVPLLRGAAASYGSWSPDGQWLLYVRVVAGPNAEIVVSRRDGSEARVLTRDPAFDGWPSWSPDGRHVAFARERGEDADIRVVASDGTGECLVAGGAGRKTSPKWRADGRAILFDRTLDGHTDLMRADVPAACVGSEAGPPIGGDAVAATIPSDGSASATLATTLLIAPEPATQNWETALALLRDGLGADADELAVTWMRARQDGAFTTTQVMLARSDGRTRFVLEPLESPTTNAGIEFDPVVRAAPGGRAIATAIGQPPQFGARRTIWVATTREDGGPLVLAALEDSGFDKGDIVAARLGDAPAVVLADRTGLRTSRDGGVTYTPPVRPASFLGSPAFVALPPDAIGLAYYGGGIQFATTRDGIAIADPVRVLAPVATLQELNEFAPGDFRVFAIPAIARDAGSGRLVVAVTDAVAADAVGVLLFESRDDGATWQSRVAPPRVPGESTFAPAIAFGPDGRLHVAYATTRDGTRVDLVHAVTGLDGDAWARTGLSTRPIAPATSIWQPFGAGGIPFFGDYFGIAVSSTAAYVSHPAVADDGTLQMAISRVGDAPRARDLVGAWYEPATSGRGFDMSWVEPGRLLVFFYGHHDDGRNLFLIGTRDGEFTTGELLTIDLVETRNGRFNGLDPDAIARVPWGRLELRFVDCARAQARLVGLDGTTELALVPLARPVGSACGP